MQPYIFSYFHCSYLVLRTLANKHTFILQGGPLKIDYILYFFKLYNTDQNHLRKNCSSFTQSLDSYYSRNCWAVLWLVKRWEWFFNKYFGFGFLIWVLLYYLGRYRRISYQVLNGPPCTTNTGISVIHTILHMPMYL